MMADLDSSVGDPDSIVDKYARLCVEFKKLRIKHKDLKSNYSAMSESNQALVASIGVREEKIFDLEKSVKDLEFRNNFLSKQLELLKVQHLKSNSNTPQGSVSSDRETDLKQRLQSKEQELSDLENKMVEESTKYALRLSELEHRLQINHTPYTSIKYDQQTQTDNLVERNNSGVPGCDKYSLSNISMESVHGIAGDAEGIKSDASFIMVTNDIASPIKQPLKEQNCSFGVSTPETRGVPGANSKKEENDIDFDKLFPVKLDVSVELPDIAKADMNSLLREKSQCQSSESDLRTISTLERRVIQLMARMDAMKKSQVLRPQPPTTQSDDNNNNHSSAATDQTVAGDSNASTARPTLNGVAPEKENHFVDPGSSCHFEDERLNAYFEERLSDAVIKGQIHASRNRFLLEELQCLLMQLIDQRQTYVSKLEECEALKQQLHCNQEDYLLSRDHATRQITDMAQHLAALTDEVTLLKCQSSASASASPNPGVFGDNAVSPSPITGTLKKNFLFNVLKK